MTQAQGPLLGCIADDFTGATDLASTLVAGGMRTVQTIGVQDDAKLADIAADAIVVALKTRTVPAREAVEQSLAAHAWLRARGCGQIFFKYCSTFDSTPDGNIGPVTQALMAATETPLAIACPAFPANQRTVYKGYLFVGDVLLSESGMRNHPLTPMRDPSLVRVLQAQTDAAVGLIAHQVVARGADAVRARIAQLRAEGIGMAIADALDDEELLVLGEACADHPLVTGGSGMAMGLPANFRRQGLLPAQDATVLPRIAGRCAVLAGSASEMTNRQVARWIQDGRPAFRIDPMLLAAGEPVVARALAFAQRSIGTPLIYATGPADDVAAVQRRLGVQAAGAMIEEAMGDLARGLREQGVRHFVVAGGETSGAVVLALGVDMLQIGAPIAPGVPATVSLGTDRMGFALKSGNFGGPDFFAEAVAALAGSEKAAATGAE
ncbi:3-oxo-tetronate kinase [Gluconacetobacter tumulisoli]|uniref:3-oxo-tetronate kinase n=1 Tax=Gluconacetobacter tumulisoli TaxID=1286189 RepID=A0A7W4PP35_9PROT|nr:3-oxo-tetronate kinase [Gluconacetobacter tumulisoli]MBB2203199.1 four-carbon acid sugar kinase family protein [Gluconacetobacter tumulisoli]